MNTTKTTSTNQERAARINQLMHFINKEVSAFADDDSKKNMGDLGYVVQSLTEICEFLGGNAE